MAEITTRHLRAGIAGDAGRLVPATGIERQASIIE
jgi:hypothetical protein